VDAHGRLRQLFHDGNRSVYGAGIMTAQIPLLDAGQSRTPTFYNQHGDWFGWGCVGLAGVMVVRRIVPGKRVD
jgi:apolipoprotein N-acyltransferase